RMGPADFGHYGLFLLDLRREEDVRMIDTDPRVVGRYGFDVEAIDAVELQRLSGGGAGHAAYHRVQRDQMLERDLAEDHSLRLRRHAFFGFDGGVQTGGPAAIERD